LYCTHTHTHERRKKKNTFRLYRIFSIFWGGGCLPHDFNLPSQGDELLAVEILNDWNLDSHVLLEAGSLPYRPEAAGPDSRDQFDFTVIDFRSREDLGRLHGRSSLLFLGPELFQAEGEQQLREEEHHCVAQAAHLPLISFALFE